MFFVTRFCLGLFLVVFSQAVVSQKSVPTISKPLVLQYTVSHSRNTDQMSLIFRNKVVELVVNTSSWQKKDKARLGRFFSDATPQLNSLKEEVQQYQARVEQTVSVLSLIKDSRIKVSVDPHAPVLSLNGKEIKEKHTYFKPLSRIIHQVWQIKWTCLECATYKKKGNRVLRISQTISDGRVSGKTKKNFFSKKDLNCISRRSGKMKCVDPQFGIFEL